ncbi:hypothetical protein BDDG_05762 [Blastomyces dermatitidis ATCC 18188]|uniref:Uncharacterized protein n=1 Tax=Ajellomyces dermatitidis (strain ATCC 18188 / CBS 674.68) TaxID=653446 RepID=F2THV5_AJEDA|nr:hypothetical protein BDDG_05762 [Blastomyces dermatitidis ATCC 18188]
MPSLYFLDEKQVKRHVAHSTRRKHVQATDLPRQDRLDKGVDEARKNSSEYFHARKFHDGEDGMLRTQVRRKRAETTPEHRSKYT